MYDLLDRPVDSLSTDDRHLLDAMRAWVHAVTLASEPAAAVAPRFADGGSAFDAAMRVLERDSTDTLVFQRPCHSTVEETEAVVLGLWRLVRSDRLAPALGAARLLVGDAAGAFVGAMQRAVGSADR
jgi:hypothetical protein